MDGTAICQENTYTTFVQRWDLNTEGTIDWSGQGSHVEFKRREDIPLVLHEVLGSGGYAVVQKVIHTAGSGAPLAQKIIRNYKKGLEPIMAEVKHIQKLRHRHLIQLVGTYALKRDLHILLFPVGQWNLRLFLEDLQDFDTSRKVYSEFCSLGTFFKCLVGALAHLHNEITPHIKHLDIKPENIIVRRYAPHRLTILLTDFGVSRSFQPESTSQDADTLYTSPIYAAPEISQRKPFGRLADVFSLGCVFAEMASVLGGKKLSDFSNHRRCYQKDGSPTVAFGSNLDACVSWLEILRPNAPFRQLSIWDSAWWVRLIELINEMMSKTPLDRPDSVKLVAYFPAGPCCDVPLEEYSTSSGLQQRILLETTDSSHLGGPSSSVVTGTQLDYAENGLYTDTLVPPTQVSIPHRMSTPIDIDWSGRGAHVETNEHDPPLLQQLDVIGLGSSSLVTRVRTTYREPYILAKKSLQKGRHLLRLEMLMQEIKMLQTLRHGHIVRLIGTLNERRFFSLLTYPAADCNLQAFLESMTPQTEPCSLDPSLSERRLALQKFFKCLTQGLHYLHSQKIKHKDIKPSNILVQRLAAERVYHVYLTDFGLSTIFNPDYGSLTAGFTGHTPKYASPEVLASCPRGRASDIFSMGCVWLEMYTVLLGERLEDFEHHHLRSADALDEAEISDVDGDMRAFAWNLPRTYQWIEKLDLYCSMHGSLVIGETERINGLEISCYEIRQGLNTVKRMLQSDPETRPNSAELSHILGSNKCCGEDVPLRKDTDTVTDGGVVGNVTQRVTSINTLPFTRDENFVGREEILREITSRLSTSSPPRVALVGLGGIGKTQIAIEYAYILREEHPKTDIFWVNASSLARYEQSLYSIAHAVGLPGLYDSDDSIQNRVISWLEDERRGHWLLILDNCDDVSTFISAPCPSTLEHRVTDLISLPRQPRGKILVTSRVGHLALQLVEDHNSIIHIECMTELESTTLLGKKLRYESSYLDEGKTLIQALGYIPLAISQAAAYIACRRPRMTISKYIDLLQRSERSQSLMLDYDSGDLRRDPSLTNSVITTWHISFEQIRAQNPSAADLLSRLSVLGHEVIPIFLLIHDKLTKSKLEEAVVTLQAYSLVTVQDEANLQVHHLVQLATRAWLQAHAEIDQRKEEALSALAEKFPDNDFHKWNTCELLEPHVRTALLYKSSSAHCRLQRAVLLHKCGEYAIVRGNFGLGTSRVQEAVSIRTDLLGLNHLDTLASLHVLALVMKKQGRYREAEKLGLRVTEASSRILGQEHPDTLSRMSNLALTYSSQGRLKEAEELCIRVLVSSEKMLGKDHPETLIRVNNLASVLYDLGKYDEAEAMHRRKLEKSERFLGPEHLDTLHSVNNLGLVLESQGKYIEAELMLQRALRGNETILGPEHPDTLNSVNNLGLVLESQGKYIEAELMLQRALQGKEKILGPEHPATLNSVYNLGLVLISQGKYNEAELMLQRALQGKEKTLGPEHPDTLDSVYNLAILYSRQQRYHIAIQLYQRANNGYVKVLGEHHPTTVACQHHYESTIQLAKG